MALEPAPQRQLEEWNHLLHAILQANRGPSGPRVPEIENLAASFLGEEGTWRKERHEVPLLTFASCLGQLAPALRSNLVLFETVGKTSPGAPVAVYADKVFLPDGRWIIRVTGELLRADKARS